MLNYPPLEVWSGECTDYVRLPASGPRCTCFASSHHWRLAPSAPIADVYGRP